MTADDRRAEWTRLVDELGGPARVARLLDEDPAKVSHLTSGSRYTLRLAHIYALRWLAEHEPTTAEEDG